MFGLKKVPKLVISEPDLQGALAHLRALPFAQNLPASWDRQRLIELVREEVGRSPNAGDSFQVAPGVFAQVMPFGVDLFRCPEPEHRLQVWLAVRGWGTDPDQVVEI